MNWLRSTVHMLCMIITVVPWATAVLLAAPFVSRQRLYRMCVGWLSIPVRSAPWLLGMNTRVAGLDNLPQGDCAGAVLLVKHQSVWETFCLPVILPRPIAYVFKKELLAVPFFGWALGRLDMIHIDRNQRMRAFRTVVQQGRRLLDQGTWVVMFPEGTRVARGEQGSYQSSGARLAIACGVPVVPVAVTSARCWPARAFVKRPGLVDISVGPQIATDGRKPHELIAQVEAWIEAEMRRLDPEAYADAAGQPEDASAPVDGA